MVVIFRMTVLGIVDGSRCELLRHENIRFKTNNNVEIKSAFNNTIQILKEFMILLSFL